MLVKATGASQKLNIKIKELGRIAKPGETFEVSNTRYKILAGSNRFSAKFVTLAEERSPVSTGASVIASDNPVKINTPVDKSQPIIGSSSKPAPTTKRKSAAKGQINVKEGKAFLDSVGDPEIILIEPGKDPVKVDKNLKPIVEPKKVEEAEETKEEE